MNRCDSEAVPDAIPSTTDEASVPAVRRVFLLTLVIFLVGTSWAAWRSIASSHADHGKVAQSIDPNTAPWWELTVLPRIGPSLSRRIVDYREERRTRMESPDAPVFRNVSDLDTVPGIGPVTLKRIGPYLRFPPGA